MIKGRMLPFLSLTPGTQKDNPFLNAKHEKGKVQVTVHSQALHRLQGYESVTSAVFANKARIIYNGQINEE